MLAFPSLNGSGYGCGGAVARIGTGGVRTPEVLEGQGDQASDRQASHTSISSYSASLSSSHTFLASGVQKYQAIAGQQVKPTQAASNIVGFIENRLLRDLAEGATKEEMQNRLQAGVDGFLEGYADALGQLGADGAMPEAVSESVGKTYRDVALGINRLAATLGLESPLAAPAEDKGVPGNNKTVNSSARYQGDSYSADSYSSRSFSFQLTTQDGDTVTIRANSEQAGSLDFASAAYRSQQAAVQYQAMNAQFSNANQFGFSVEGELDDGELKAINQLLGQINTISDTFFSGDVFAAYQQALQTGFDSDEIARFSLNLKMTDFSRVSSAYSAMPERQNDNLPPQAKLAGFIRQVEDARLRAQQFGIDLLSLSGLISDDRFGNHPAHPRFKPAMADILGSLERLRTY